MPDDSTYIGLTTRLFDDFVVILPEYTFVEAQADRAVLLKRVRSEGMSFLTVTLPMLGKELDSSFQAGSFKPVPGFARERGRTTPKFMRAMFKLVFSDDGKLLDNPSPVAVGCIRQACFFLYKLESEYTPELVDKCVKQFVATDVELGSYDSRTPALRPIIWRARKIIESVFADFDPADIVPRPGPGASASGSHKSRRYEPMTIWDQVHQVYPTYEYFYSGTDHLLDRVRDYSRLPRKGAPVSKLRLVPKDSRGPRIICMEEQEVMFLQQGLADKMRDRMESHRLTRGHVNFRDQTVNQRLSLSASLGSVAAGTLDMKEASDRVSRQLVADLFVGCSQLCRALLALSTRSIELPDGTVLKTNKYAPMGSSLCFPIMSIVHFALGVACIQVDTAKSAEAIAKDLYVYGDDIVAHTEYVDTLFETFPKFGLVFNRGKSFVVGPFRESCGVDAFLGKNVTPQRIKKRFFDGHTPRDIRAALDVEGHLYERGYLRTAEYLRTILDSRLGGSTPFVLFGSGVVGFQRRNPDEVDASMLRHSYNRKFQTPMVKAMVLTTAPEASMSSGWEQLMRFFSGTLRGSQRLDGRFTTYAIGWQAVPIYALYGKGTLTAHCEQFGSVT